MRLLASRRERWGFLTEKPTDPNKMTPAEAEDGFRGECWLTTNSRLTASGATTTAEAAICDGVAAQQPTGRQFEGSLELFRDLDPETGLPVEGGDELFALLHTFGTRLWIWKSKGPLHTEEAAAGQPYSLYEVVTDEPQDPSDRTGSFKEVVPLFVADAWTNKTFASA